MADDILGHTTEEWMPMPPNEGPPLPKFLNIYWPWYKALPGTYQLIVNKVGNGTVTPGSGSYTAGSTVTLTAVPDAGSVFDHWEGDATGTSPTVDILMDGDKSVTAYFTAKLAYSCPYCDQSFDTLKELIDHVAAAHPDKPPLQEIEITWE